MPVNKGYKPFYGDPIYIRWKGIRNRTMYTDLKKDPHYSGVELCEEWKNFHKFREWAVSSGFSVSLTIDRIDPEKGYNPDNCRWVTLIENVKRKRKGNTGKWDRTGKDLRHYINRVPPN